MKASRIISFCAKQEATLDHHLFAKVPKDDLSEEEAKGVLHDARVATAKGVAVAGGLGIAGQALATSKAVKNRLGGLRSTVPGFAGKSSLAQRAIATGSVVKDAATAGASKVAGATKGAVTGVTRAAGRAMGAYSTARNTAGLGMLPASLRAGKKALNPLLGGLKRIAKIGA